MRQILATLLMAFVTVLSQAQARWLETEHDFGAFNEDDGKVSTEFKFINDSGEPLTIDHVRSSCGCTVPQYSKATINRGDTAAITVVYNPSGRPGRFSKSLMVKLSNDSTERLLIKGVVIGAQNTLRSRFPVAVGPIRLRGCQDRQDKIAVRGGIQLLPRAGGAPMVRHPFIPAGHSGP